MANSTRSVIAGSAATLVGTVVSAVVSVAYLSLGARWLGPVGFGEVAAALAMANLFFTALHPLDTGLTLQAAGFAGRGESGPMRDFFVRALRGLLLLAIVTLCLWVALSWLLARFVWASQAAPLQWLGVFCCAALVQCLPRASLRGREMFGTLAINLVLETVVRTSVGLGLLGLHAGPVGMLVGYALGTLAAVVHGARGVLSALADVRSFPAQTVFSVADVLLPFRSVSAPLLGLKLYSALMMNVDVLVAARFLPAHEAGLYAGASSVARIVSVGASPLLFVLISRLAAMSAARRDTSGMLRRGASWLLLGLSLSILIPVLGGEQILQAFLGEAYVGAYSVLLCQWATACVLAAQLFFADALLATARLRAGWLLLLPAGALVLGLLIWHGSALVIARTTLLASGFLGSAVYFLLWRWRAQR